MSRPLVVAPDAPPLVFALYAACMSLIIERTVSVDERNVRASLVIPLKSQTFGFPDASACVGAFRREAVLSRSPTHAARMSAAATGTSATVERRIKPSVWKNSRRLWGGVPASAVQRKPIEQHPRRLSKHQSPKRPQKT